MIAADQGRDKNLSLLNVQCYLYGQKFLTVLRNFTYKEDHRNFPVAKRKSDREWIYGIRTLVTQRSDSNPQSLTFFRVYILQLKTYGFHVFIILLKFCIEVCLFCPVHVRSTGTYI